VLNRRGTLGALSTSSITVRRELRSQDPEAIVELHRRVYVPEYGMNEAFLDGVRSAVYAAADAGWPREQGGVWLLDGPGALDGAMAFTEEGGGVGRVRWVVFAPELRGRGLGRQLIGELLSEARGAGLRRLELETFSELKAAARIYRDVGFRVVWEREREDWGPRIVYQHYELEL
jgi:ribosomal protein S18 acetylase RimI-like enzyme